MRTHEALARAALIASREIETFTEAWADWCDDRSGENELRKTTILDYLSPVRSRYKKQSATSNSQIDQRHLTSKAAWLLIEYLYVLNEKQSLCKHEQIDAFALVLKAELDDEIDKRSIEPFQNCRQHTKITGEMAGVYSMVRVDTGIMNYQYEVLFLDAVKMRHKWMTQATYIRPEVVYRGPWMITDNAVFCTLGGYAKSSSSPRMTSLTIFRGKDDTNKMLYGMLSGLGTIIKFPVITPFILLELSKDVSRHRSFFRRNDARLRAEFSKLHTDVDRNAEMFKFLKIFDENLRVSIIDPTKFFAPIRQYLERNMETIRNPEIYEWCKSSSDS